MCQVYTSLTVRASLMAEDRGPAAGESQHPASLGKRWDILAEDPVDAVGF